MAMKACDDIELQQLYDDLRKYNDNKPLNSFLELEFKNRLNKPKEKANVSVKTTTANTNSNSL